MLWRSFIASVLATLLVAYPVSAKPAKDKLGPETAEKLLQLHNAERAKEGVPALKMDAKLTAAAQDYAEFLAKTGKKGHLANGNPGTRIKDAGYQPTAFAENMAKGQKTPEGVVNSWMHSDGHRKNILNKSYQDVGFGYAVSGHGRIVWVVDFGANGSAKNKRKKK